MSSPAMSARLLLFVLALCCLAPARAAVALLSTPQGLISGFKRDGVSAWLGIPYALPPLGALRWRPPQPHPGWDGVRPAVEYGPLCPQNLVLIEGQIPPVAENCLTLNVWSPTPRPDKPLPVIVWLHGGGYFQGGASQTPTDGMRLAKRGVVFVSVNFRLGALGFLAHPALSREAGQSGTASSGNYGLADQLAALEWVRTHIASYGGDPGNVTLMGQSSGAVTATSLATSARARGLFHKLILHSGSVAGKLRRLREPVGDWTSMEALGERFAAALRLGFDADPLPKMRAASWQDVDVAWRRTLAGLRGDGTWHHLGVDGVLLTEAPGAAFAAGRQAPLPVLAGTTADEGSWFARRARLHGRAQFDAYVAEVYGKNAVKPVRQRYAARAKTRDDWLAAASRMLRDQFRADLGFTADAMAKLTPQVWLYEFRREHIPGGRFARLGDYHSAELPYVFEGLPPELAGNAWHTALAEELATRWATFAATGSPNPPGRKPWLAYDSATRTVNLAGTPGTTRLSAPPLHPAGP